MKKINNYLLATLFGLAGLLEGCSSVQGEKFGSMLYERTIDPSGNLIQEKFVLNGRGKDAEEVYRRFDQIYENSSKDTNYRSGVLNFRGFGKSMPGKI